LIEIGRKERRQSEEELDELMKEAEAAVGMSKDDVFKKREKLRNTLKDSTGQAQADL